MNHQMLERPMSPLRSICRAPDWYSQSLARGRPYPRYSVHQFFPSSVANHHNSSPNSWPSSQNNNSPAEDIYSPDNSPSSIDSDNEDSEPAFPLHNPYADLATRHSSSTYISTSPIEPSIRGDYQQASPPPSYYSTTPIQDQDQDAQVPESNTDEHDFNRSPFRTTGTPFLDGGSLACGSEDGDDDAMDTWASLVPVEQPVIWGSEVDVQILPSPPEPDHSVATPEYASPERGHLTPRHFGCDCSRQRDRSRSPGRGRTQHRNRWEDSSMREHEFLVRDLVERPDGHGDINGLYLDTLRNMEEVEEGHYFDAALDAEVRLGLLNSEDDENDADDELA